MYPNGHRITQGKEGRWVGDSDWAAKPDPVPSVCHSIHSSQGCALRQTLVAQLLQMKTVNLRKVRQRPKVTQANQVMELEFNPTCDQLSFLGPIAASSLNIIRARMKVVTCHPEQQWQKRNCAFGVFQMVINSIYWFKILVHKIHESFHPMLLHIC